MKIKTLFVAPYQAMENLIRECQKEENRLDVTIKVANLQEGVELAKHAEAEGYDVIISRGGTAKLIRDVVNLPVVDIHISGYDMLRVLTLANDFSGKKAIVGFSNITLGAKAITDLLEIPVDIFTIQDGSQMLPLAYKLKKEGYQLIMGDVVTVNAVSAVGLNGILIQSGMEAIMDAFEEAVSLTELVRKIKLENECLKVTLRDEVPNIIVFKESGQIVFEKWKGYSERPISFNDISMLANHKGATRVIQHHGASLKIEVKKITVKENHYMVCKVSDIHDEFFTDSWKIETINFNEPIVSQSGKMKDCLALVDLCLAHDQFVLIGEQGSGKELIARYIHLKKYQQTGLYAAVYATDFLKTENQACYPEIQTLYIRAVEKIPQAKRNHFMMKIEEFTQNGMAVILSMDREHADWGDLIYHDAVARITVPPLRERKEDIRELAAYYIAHYHQTLGTPAVKINDEGIELLSEYDWPGNVSELRALIKDAALLEKGYVIEKRILEELISRKNTKEMIGLSNLLTGTLEDIEKKVIKAVLAEEEFNQTKAAKRLNINRATLWRKLKQ
ncbi:sigma-54-dependent transcriptional regulator [Heyndrickxia coagulans]|uniref:Transcriptional regulator, Fis family n=1 Tax=Heyndrickxia coagulans TaxID=1398 RepID=A0A133KZK5_HEYCO|nr:sigma-54-dependent transcriptional regulator [Heyndrickxia coagulans]KWZ85139.1 transcriptional regulator, Fis family [Heyndrickxia coagulans]